MRALPGKLTWIGRPPTLPDITSGPPNLNNSTRVTQQSVVVENVGSFGFTQSRLAACLLVLTTYQPAFEDVKLPQAKVYVPEQEYAQSWRPLPQVILQTETDKSTRVNQQNVVVENVSTFGYSPSRAQQNLLIISSAEFYDLVPGHDTYGWPEPDPPWCPAIPPNFHLRIDTVPVYSPTGPCFQVNIPPRTFAANLAIRYFTVCFEC